MTSFLGITSWIFFIIGIIVFIIGGSAARTPGAVLAGSGLISLMVKAQVDAYNSRLQKEKNFLAVYAPKEED